MEFLGTLIGAVRAGFQGNDTVAGNLAREVIGRFQGNEGGGLAGLVEQLRSKGLGEIVQSWIGTGPNKEVTPEQLGQAIEPGMLEQLACRLGISPQEVTTHLAGVLPKIVDRLTPNGQLPSTIPGLDAGSCLTEAEAVKAGNEAAAG